MKFLKYFCAASLLAASAGTLWSCDDDDDKRLTQNPGWNDGLGF